MALDDKDDCAARARAVEDPSTLSTGPRAEHLALDWTIDFARRRIRGSVSYRVRVGRDAVTGAPLATRFVVDTSGGLEIFGATVDGSARRVHWGPPHPVFGRSASVDLDLSAEKPTLEAATTTPHSTTVHTVRFEYETGAACTAAQWLEPAQTADGGRPYMFTQSQAIHARSLLPCQDSPGRKLTWEGTIRAPRWATVLASALLVHETRASDEVTTRWRQPVPTSTYLIAVACGALVSRELSPRCRVWAESSVVDKAAVDFAATEAFLSAAEKIADAPYAWTRYDLLCLPPSFPYGGMENPNLTTLTPTLLAGDGSLAGVVAHEIAHSWTGNLVTNATWHHFWLNEGWTRWFERKIRARVECAADDDTIEQASSSSSSSVRPFVDFDVAMARSHLTEDVAVFEARGLTRLTALVPPIDGIDPDDAFSAVPYEKGSSLLHAIEARVGESAFLDCFRAYLKTFARGGANDGGVVTTAAFRAFVEARFPAELKGFDWDAWLFAPGDLPERHALDESLVARVRSLADALRAGGFETAVATADAFATWPTDHKSFLLDLLLEARPPVGAETLASIDALFAFSATTNSELRFRWLKLLLAAGSAAGVAPALRMATTQGRMKFTRPLFRAVAASGVPGALDRAREAFEAHRAFYHPICRKMVDADLDLAAQQQQLLLRGPRGLLMDGARTVADWLAALLGRASTTSQNDRLPRLAATAAGLGLLVLGVLKLRRAK